MAITELDRLHTELERVRTQRQHGMQIANVSDCFRGYGVPDVQRLIEMLDVPRPTENSTIVSVGLYQQLVLRIKYGCTCGSCVGGFLSPRAIYQLTTQAEMLHDTLMDSYDDLYELVDEHTSHLPQRVRANLKTNKAMRAGFAQVSHLFSGLQRLLERL